MEKWTRLDFRDPRAGHELEFTVWKLVQHGLTVAGSSPLQCRNKMAARLAEASDG